MHVSSVTLKSSCLTLWPSMEISLGPDLAVIAPTISLVWLKEH